MVKLRFDGEWIIRHLNVKTKLNIQIQNLFMFWKWVKSYLIDDRTFIPSLTEHGTAITNCNNK